VIPADHLEWLQGSCADVSLLGQSVEKSQLEAIATGVPPAARRLLSRAAYGFRRVLPDPPGFVVSPAPSLTRRTGGGLLGAGGSIPNFRNVSMTARSMPAFVLYSSRSRPSSSVGTLSDARCSS
jgi:hypothetical protein